MRRGGERGAALLDVLVALALTGMLAGAVGGMLRAGLLTTERAGARSEAGAAALLLRRELTGLLATIEAATPEAGPSFRADAEGLRWRGVDPDDGAARWLRLTPDLALGRCEGPDGPCEDAPPEGPAAFAFLDAEGAWREDWPLGAPPALIRVTAGADEILIAPRILGAQR